MTTTHTATFQLDTATSLDAMVSGGREIIKGWQWWSFTVQMIALVFFAPLGVIAMSFVFLTDDTRQTVITAMPLFVLVLGGFFLWLQRHGYKTLAAISAQSRFNRTSTVELTALGMSLITPHSRWFTGWKDVEAVTRSKKSITVVVSGIVLPIPLTALDDPDTVFGDVTRWFEAAR
ncbi:hypothetical protein [Yoonia sp. 208BN28-4]|uniref:hypothetical protein n=1 Tax=Yoonia sp. 208BN28-4 TaxID=3126505 RepID=UPI00309A534D